MTNEPYTTDAETTRAIKAALRKCFPSCKFSVTRGGSQIAWTNDGPDVSAVEDAILAAGLAEPQQGYDSKRWLRIEGNHRSSIYLDRYSPAERAAAQQESERRRAEYEDRCTRTNAALAAAVRTKNEGLRALRRDPPKLDESALQAAYDGFEALRQRAEAAVAIAAEERQRRPSWAPPLTLDGELLELCFSLNYLTPDVAPIARLWAIYADPKGSGRVLREHLSTVPLFGIECRGFQLFAGSERGNTGELLFEAQRTQAGVWRFGPAPNIGGHFYPSHEWQRLTHARLTVEDRRDRGEAWPDDPARLDRLIREIAELEAQDLAATAARQKFAGQRNRALELARERVLSFAGAPDAQMQLAARLWGHCCICGKTLTDPLSLERGIGPDCRQKLIEFIRAYASKPVEVLMFYTGMPEEFIRAVINEMQAAE